MSKLQHTQHSNRTFFSLKADFITFDLHVYPPGIYCRNHHIAFLVDCFLHKTDWFLLHNLIYYSQEKIDLSYLIEDDIEKGRYRLTLR